MSIEPAIKVEKLSKRYLISTEVGSGNGLRHAVEDTIKKFLNRSRVRSETMEFWALNDVSFDISPGEVVGVIGRNGAGKSTLLKILSRITEPTEGRVTINGRVASLLEVGTGFHPELTGRENIYLNGAILGMSRREIDSKFDEMVAFAEVEQFLDTPVKRYSSGMYVRLAFAVAAHLEPDILIVDEVLAVGDIQFQKKCLGKMQEVSRQGGRTVLFVSHNMGAVSALTNQAIYLKSGSLVATGPTRDVISQYLSEHGDFEGSKWEAAKSDTNPVQVLSLCVNSKNQGTEIEVEDRLIFELEYEVRSKIDQVILEIYLLTSDGYHLLTLGQHDADPEALGTRSPGRYRSMVEFQGGLLGLGSYTVSFNVGTVHGETFEHREAIRFALVENRSRTARAGRRGALVPLAKWRTTPLP